MQSLANDLKYSLRRLLRKPLFVLVVILTLGLGIGANTAIFSVVNVVLLHNLPYREPDRLMLVWGIAPQAPRTPVSAANFLDLKEQNKVFENVSAFNGTSVIITSLATPERVRGSSVTPGFFEILGAQPALGRTFAQDEGVMGRNNVVILSHALWMRDFGGDRNIVGQTIALNKIPHVVVGVMPAKFEFSVPGYMQNPEIWRAAALIRDESQRRNAMLRVVGRLKPGISLNQAQMDMTSVARGLARQFPEADSTLGIKLVGLEDQLVSEVRPNLLLLAWVVSFVLLIACVNVTNLQLESTNSRKKEIGLQAALGAQRSDLMRQLMVESLLLSFAGGLLGITLAAAGIVALKETFPDRVPAGLGALLDVRVLLFSIGLSIFSGILFGISPALRSGSFSLVDSLKEIGQRASASRAFSRMRDVLIVVEFAVSLLLLVAAGLLVKSFGRLMNAPLGFNTNEVVTISVNLPAYSYSDPAKQLAFYRQATSSVKSVPGVRLVGGIDDLPLGGDRDADTFFVEGRPAPSMTDLPLVQTRTAVPGYFASMQIPVIRGRDLTDDDSSGSLPVLLINQAFAGQYFPGEDPIGKHLRLGTPLQPSTPSMVIVGVVGDSRDLAVEAEAKPEIYRPYAQAPVPYMTLTVLSGVSPASLTGSIQQTIHGIDGTLPVFPAMAMRETLARVLEQRRFTMFLVGLFAVVALMLAGIGIYGVTAYSVAQRTQEIGIRMALGARREDVFRLVLKKGLLLATTGIAAGFFGFILLGRVMSGLIYGLGLMDPATYGEVSLLLVVVALLACFVPALRATRVPPMVALRAE